MMQIFSCWFGFFILNSLSQFSFQNYFLSYLSFISQSPTITYLGLDLLDLPFINISAHFDKGVSFIDDALLSGSK